MWWWVDGQAQSATKVPNKRYSSMQETYESTMRDPKMVVTDQPKEVRLSTADLNPLYMVAWPADWMHIVYKPMQKGQLPSARLSCFTRTCRQLRRKI